MKKIWFFIVKYLSNIKDKGNYSIKNTTVAHGIIYTLPLLGFVLLISPVASVLGGIYAKYFGFSLTTIATVIFAARLFDAVTDPVVGYYSDRIREKTGTRKPIVFLGALFLVVCSYFLFVPSAETGTGYFVLWYMAFYLAYTLFYVPYMAWASEFTESSNDKTLIFSFIAAVNQVGGMFFYLLPLLPFFPTAEVTPEILKVSVFLGGVLLLLGLLAALRSVPNGSDGVAIPIEHKHSCKESRYSSLIYTVLDISSKLIRNRPLIVFIVTFMCLGVGVGMWMGMFFLFVDAYLQLGFLFSEVSLWGLVIGVLAVPVWYRISLILGKKKALFIVVALLFIVFLYTGCFRPEFHGFSALLALNMLMMFSMAGMNVIALPMLCDIIDYGKLKYASECGGLYFSIYGLMTKVQIDRKSTV